MTKAELRANVVKAMTEYVRGCADVRTFDKTFWEEDIIPYANKDEYGFQDAAFIFYRTLQEEEY